MRASWPLGALAAWLWVMVSITGCASTSDTNRSAAAVTGDDLIVVAVADAPSTRPPAGAAARADYRQAAPYSGGDQALDLAAAVADAHGLQEIRAWTITTLNWRCMLYRLPPGAARQAVIASLAADPRVQLAQPLNEFQTLAAPKPTPTPAPAPTPSLYNDPYLSLQSGFAAINAGGAQRMSRGERVTVAVIDTAIDGQHPDLLAQGMVTRDFVGGPSTGEHHGTEVAGIIGAAANNGIGIVGVAPAARLLSLRACWATTADAPARCNTFTLAQALVAAIAEGADIINLSLGGPRDPLLERLAQQAMARGTVIVGATPTGGRREGFPSALPGVLAVASREDGMAAVGVLSAPGLRVLTLAPGGGYDFASGSSLATAHVSGAVALLRALDSKLDSAALERLLGAADPDKTGGKGDGIDACRALQRLRPAAVSGCADRP